MTYYFLESSALAKLFIYEAGSEPLARLMEQTEDARKLVSSLASLEVRSAIRRRQRMGEIPLEDADHALDDLSFENRRMMEQPLSPAVVDTARELLDAYPLRSLDALHLATCLVARETLQSTDICFVCSDKALLNAAESENFATLNPANF
ncbi:MAG: type II toxin-antitoxin system VapC family toxin [Acidobacteriaceae bacterium]